MIEFFFGIKKMSLNQNEANWSVAILGVVILDLANCHDKMCESHKKDYWPGPILRVYIKSLFKKTIEWHILIMATIVYEKLIKFQKCCAVTWV